MARGKSPRARERRIARALDAIERRFGAEVVRRLRGCQPPPAAPGVPTGSLGLDLILGTGGFPRGRLTELLGRTTSGKTRLLFGAIAATQRQGGRVALIDAPARANPQALERCGVAVEDLVVIQPASAADALALLTLLVHSTGFDLVALASLAALRDYPLGVAPGAHAGATPSRDASTSPGWSRAGCGC